MMRSSSILCCQRRDGLEVCRNLRQQHLRTPIILLTARDTVDDRVKGLDSGADDYLISLSPWMSCERD